MQHASQAPGRYTLGSHILGSRILGGLAIAALTLSIAAIPAAAADGLKVVASVGPIGSLTATVMRGVGAPTVLLPAGASPHSYALRPSEARALASADVVLWVGEALETFLEEPLAALARPGAVVELIEVEGLVLYPARTGGIWEADDDDDHDHGHAAGDEHAPIHGNVDPHLWLDPRNAAAIVDRIAGALSQRDPAHAAAYRANAAATKAGIADLDRELAGMLAPLRNRPYVVFHDAYQYLERRYGLTPLGAVTVGPDRGPGAKRLARLRDEIRARGAVCAFREPQFTPRVLESLGADTGIRIGVLDPLGAEITPGPDGYAELMRTLAASLAGCLLAEE